MQAMATFLPMFPLLSAIICHALADKLGDKFYRLSIGASLLTLVWAAFLLAQMVADTTPHAHALLGGMINIYADPLSTVMAVVVSGISLIVHVYSIRYMQDDRGYVRFFVLLDLITAVILIMVLAGDLLVLLVAWHFIGVLLYFLLNYNFTSDRADRYAFWTLISYRIGDLPLLIAVVLLYHAYGTFSIPLLFERIADNPDMLTLFGLPLLETTGYLIILSAFAKSAQFPLHTWLPYSMEGPTPVSALMHAGIVNAGGFLINRFAPVFPHTGDVLNVAFVIGLITAIMGSALMLMQNDIKKSLGYSTMGQMGYMIMECGLGAFSLAVFHLIAHGVFKATLFLGSGSVINAVRKNDGEPEDEVYKFVAEHKVLRSRLPWVFFAVITLLVPLIIVGFAHWFVATEFLRHQGEVVLLFFGWITGAQVLFSIYKLGGRNPWKVLFMAVLSFTVVVIGYVVIGHGFDAFLYQDAALRDALYGTANIDLVGFDIIVAIVTLLIVGGWVLVYYGTVNKHDLGQRFSNLYLYLYSLFSREFYVADLYTRLTEIILGWSKRLNNVLRWG